MKRINADNRSVITSVFIVGFRMHHSYRLALFSLFLVIFVLTLSLNLLIISLIFSSKLSHSPMYVFLSNLSAVEVLFISDLVPPMLYILLGGRAMFPLASCFTQFFVCGLLGLVESFLLSAMSFDRYVAICKPLHYSLIMDVGLCLRLIFMTWSLGFLIMTIFFSLLQTLQFCEPNVIDHFFCDIAPLLKLSCSDTSIIELALSLLSSTATTFPFLVIIVTYGFIIRAIVRISSSEGKEKAFSTCSSHLGVVLTFYTTLTAAYVVPPGHLLVTNKTLALIYTFVTPLINPFIYSLRNKELQAVIKQNWTFKELRVRHCSL
ncbi:olfactory receptor 6B1-like [Gastrophryne carolinensis]